MLILIIVILYFREEIDILLVFFREIFYTESKDVRLKRVLEAARNIPFYKDKKYVTKKEFMENIEKVVPVNTLTKEKIYTHLKTADMYYKDYVICTTSGTSGQMGIFINDKKSWIKMQSVLFSKLFYPYIFDFLPCVNITVVFVVADNGHFMTRKIAIPVIKTFFVNVIILSIFDENLLKKINSYSPQILHMYPSNLENIYSQLTISPKIITTGSEKLSSNLRKKLSVKFPKSRIIETYGCSECVLIGSSCKFGNIHLHEDVCIVEAVKNNEIIEEKYIKSDKIYITNLINEFSPIIRYELNDCIEYIDCFCGKEGKAILVHGREDDTLELIDIYGKTNKHFPISIETIFVSIPYFFTYQVINENQNYLKIIVNCEREIEEQLSIKISENIENYFKLYNIIYKIFFHIPFILGKSGKMRQIIKNPASNCL